MYLIFLPATMGVAVESSHFLFNKTHLIRSMTSDNQIEIFCSDNFLLFIKIQNNLLRSRGSERN